MASSYLCGSLFLERLNTSSLSLGQTFCALSMHPIIKYCFCSNQRFTSASSHTKKALNKEKKRNSSLIRTALPFRVMAHGGSWPHFYYRCLLLMISSKLILKDPAAFKLSLSHFMAVTTLSQEKSVATGKHAPKSSETPCTSTKPAASHGTCKE